MSSRLSFRRQAACLLAGALVLLGTPAVASSATAAPVTEGPAVAWVDGPCADATGVTVVVDLSNAPGGGDVVRRCAEVDPATAFAALDQVEVSPEHGVGEGETGPYEYLCRISGVPSVTEDPCTGFLPNAPYWAFWVPDLTDTDWTYAEEGVDTYDPAPGDVLGFSFGAGTAADPNEMSLTLSEALDPNWSSAAP